MVAQTSISSKLCCKCGRDVTTAKRMKDREGKYWCLPCGQADQKLKSQAVGGMCAGCGESYSASQMTQLGGMPYCDKCLKKKYQRNGPSALSQLTAVFDLSRWIPSGGGGESGGRMKWLLIFIGILVLVSLAVNFLL